MSKAAKDLIKKMLQKLPQNRLTASEALADPWIKQFHRGGTQGVNNQNGASGTPQNRVGSPPTTVKPLCVSALT